MEPEATLAARREEDKARDPHRARVLLRQLDEPALAEPGPLATGLDPLEAQRLAKAHRAYALQQQQVAALREALAGMLERRGQEMRPDDTRSQLEAIAAEAP
jgi:hypothetical protein